MDPTQWGAPFPVVVAALFVIVLFRANATYWVGRLAVHQARRTRLARYFETPRYERALDRVARWGPLVVTLSFFTIGIQTVVNLAAGATRMPLSRYLPAMAFGCLAWALIYATIGFVGFEALGQLYDRSPATAVTVGLLLASGLIAATVIGRRRNSPAA